MGKESNSINTIGKYGLIEHIIKKYDIQAENEFQTTGDDAVIIRETENELSIVSTDLLLEGIHFNLTYTPLRHLGYKSVIRGISDIIAMGGTPEHILTGIGLSSKFSLENVDELYDGILMACKRYKLKLAGGDTTSSVTGLTISVSATGSVKKNRLIRRSGARQNDLICVTGDLGAAYTGLQILERERRLFEKDKDFRPDLTGYDVVIGRQLKPELQTDLVQKLADAGIQPTAMIDITEGLAADLMKICRASGKGCRIFSKQIPVSVETIRVSDELGLDPLIPALNGGDDFEFLFTVTIDKYDIIKGMPGISVIGHITGEGSGTMLVGPEGTEIELTAPGFGIQEG
jgi:thiamine-monophosphate kinase